MAAQPCPCGTLAGSCTAYHDVRYTAAIGGQAVVTKTSSNRPERPNLDIWPLPGSDSSARFEIILPAVLPLEKCRSSRFGEARCTRASVTPVDSRSQQVQRCGHRFPNDILSAVGGHLHANPSFFRTLSNPVSWNVASWPGPCPLNTLIFSRAPSGSDRRSSTASFL